MRLASKWTGMVTLLALAAACGEGGSAARSVEATGPRLTAPAATHGAGQTGSRATALTALSVYINGYSPVHAGSTCVYYTQVSGGTAPYTYAWTASGGSFSVISDGAVEATRSTAGTLSLGVTVTDALGQTATAYKNVSFTTTAPYCAS